MRFAQVVAMMPVVTIVVTQHTPVIDRTNERIDVSQTVFHDLLTLKPDLFLEDSTAPFACQISSVINPLLGLGGLLLPSPVHPGMIPQVGYR